jgi:hypothetical protein
MTAYRALHGFASGWEIAMRLIVSTAAVALFALFSTSPARAEVASFKATLKAASEVPPNDSAATGTIAVTYDTATRKLFWQGTYTGLTGPETMAHFHGPAATGANAGVVVPVEAMTSPFTGSATLTDAQAADLMAGKMYFNVHTEKNKGGEIRGQIEKAP